MADRSSGDQSAPLSFDNGNTAWRVEERPGDDPRALIDLLGLGSAPHPVLVVCGGADGMTDDQLDRAGEVLGPAVARAAGARGATVVDGGTDAGVMRVIGEARSEDRRAMPVLVGVSPRGKVREPGEPADKRTELQRNHSHFVFADSARWGGETPLLFDVAAGLSAHLPAVVVLANGETHSRGEALEAVRRGWPLVLVEGLGGLADEVVAISRLSKRARGDADPVLCRLAEYDRLAICDGEDVLADCLAWELSDQPVLMSAWGMFAAYDKRADGLQKAFIRLQRVIILIGIVVTGLALLHGATSGAGERAVHWATVILPSVIALAVAWLGRRAIGKRWVLLRAAAEAVKVETYRYRTQARPYEPGTDRGSTLAGRLAVINGKLSDSEAVTGPLARPTAVGPPEDLEPGSLADLEAESYVQSRVVDQIDYYRRRAGEKSRRRDAFLLTTLAMGGAGTVLAASDVELAVAFTTAVAAGAASYVASLQHERDVVVFNQSASELDAVQVEWLAAGASRNERTAVDRLVDRTEEILTDEVGEWARRMARAMDDQTREQAEAR